jgi:sucrose-6-phosphate hydrolase SacC (GH32 family)
MVGANAIGTHLATGTSRCDAGTMKRLYQFRLRPHITIGVLVLTGGFGVRSSSPALAGDEIVLADFEGPDYGQWQATGDAFGTAPAQGTLPGQQIVSGYLGRGLVNSFLDGDKSTGTLNSPEFTIERPFINLLVGGGRHPGETCVNLVHDGQVVATATGTATTGADDEHLSWRTWDVSKLAGKRVRIEIVDRHSGDWGHVNVDQIEQSNRRRMAVAADEGLALAMASLEGARHRAEADPGRPVFHVLPPALWNNDPNGPIFYNGYYHLFYQLNPFGDRWQHMHWGHVRSRDLAHWEHLPIALAPSRDLGEEHVFSGCAAIDGRGRVMLFYTSIGNRLPEQWAAIAADDDLITWTKHPSNPILTEKLHDERKVAEWRDPFVFRHDDKTFMVAGGNLNGNQGGQAVVNLYQSENDELTNWTYLGVLFQHPDQDVRNIECPLFLPLADKWLLVISQGQPVQYFVGDFDTATTTFHPERRGVMDWGNHYAPNCLADPTGRRILWGWVNGFPGGRGWNGCLTLPRVLSLTPDGRLTQTPAPELELLRGELTKVDDIVLADTSRLVEGVRGDALEIIAQFEPGTAKTFGLRVRRSDDGTRSATIAYDGKVLDVAGKPAEFELAPDEKTLTLRIFVDHSVLEVYANQQACVTRVIEAGPAELGVEVFAGGGTARLRSLSAWHVSSIW